MGSAVVFTVAGANVAFAQHARGQLEIAGYLGTDFALNNDLTIIRPGGTNVTFYDVPWDAEPFDFDEAPYYGMRVTYWLASMPNLGFGIDYTHAKVAAKLDNTVRASGTIGDVLVTSPVLLSSQFDTLEFTHGLNILTAHVFYRYPIYGVVPYVGIGVGATIPHTEVAQIGFPRTYAYQLGGVAGRLYAGLEVPIIAGLSAFGEYQISYEQVNDPPLVGGGTVNADFVLQHINLGLSYAFNFF
jgi:lipid A oxidase